MLTLRQGHFVYIPITKIASTTHIDFFQRRLGWQPDCVSAIDWQHDHVFAHIIHPMQRHLKGTVECIEQHGLQQFLDNLAFQKLITRAFFDLHSYPISVSLGYRANYVDWLLFDLEGIKPNSITVKFLQDNDIAFSESDIPPPNPRRNLELLSRIKTLFEQEGLNSNLMHLYQLDFDLYNTVCHYFDSQNLHQKKWHDISWLSNRPLPSTPENA